MNYESTKRVDSTEFPGVSFTIRRMSFGRRIELTRRILEMGAKLDYLKAGEGIRDKLDAALVEAEIEGLYLEWGLAEVDGLEIDGRPVNPQDLAGRGPEALCEEVVRAIKAECGLSEDERKN